MKTKLTNPALAGTLALIPTINLSAQTNNTVPVGVDNFIRAETDLYFGNVVKAVASASSTTGANQPRSIIRTSFT